VTSATNSQALVDAVRADSALASGAATFVHVRDGGHAMLRRFRIWDDLTANFVMSSAVGAPPGALLAQAIAAGDSVI